MQVALVLFGIGAVVVLLKHVVRTDKLRERLNILRPLLAGQHS